MTVTDSGALVLPRALEGPQWREAQLDDLEADGTVVMRAVPYGVETLLAPDLAESFAEGAFSKAGAAPHRVKIFHNHGGPLIGHALEVDDRADGAWVRARVSATVAGTEALTLLRDKVLDAVSIEFRPLRAHMTISRDDAGVMHVRHTRAHLLGVAFVPHGAYADAVVASVRDQLSAAREARREAVRRLMAELTH